jgi:predicted metal-dependent hydrolase
VDPQFQDRLERGVTLFNEASFFEAHEVWEDSWRASEGEARIFLQGLIQIAAGFVKLQRGEPRGMLLLLDAGAGKLRRLTPAAWGVDINGLLLAVSTWSDVGKRMVETGDRAFEAKALPRLRLQTEGVPE